MMIVEFCHELVSDQWHMILYSIKTNDINAAWI